MSFQINTIDEIGKLLPFVRARAKGNFEIGPELIDVAIESLRRFAKENNIIIEIVAPDDERLLMFCGGGILAGAALGYVGASIPGLILGAVAGGLAGFSLAHVRVRMRLPAAGDQHPPLLQIF